MTEASTAIEMLHNVNKHAFGQNLEAELASEAAYEAVASKIHSHCDLRTRIAHRVHSLTLQVISAMAAHRRNVEVQVGVLQCMKLTD